MCRSTDRSGSSRDELLYLIRDRAKRKAELTNWPPPVDNLYDKLDVTGSRDKGKFASLAVITESWKSGRPVGGTRCLFKNPDARFR